MSNNIAGRAGGFMMVENTRASFSYVDIKNNRSEQGGAIFTYTTPDKYESEDDTLLYIEKTDLTDNDFLKDTDLTPYESYTTPSETYDYDKYSHTTSGGGGMTSDYHNYTDINKTQPQQDFDPYLILGGSKLGAKLDDIRRRNALSELSQFTLYLITAYVGDSTNGYRTEKHVNCTIQYNSLGGDANVNMPISAFFSNDITNGHVDKLSIDFTFTPDI